MNKKEEKKFINLITNLWGSFLTENQVRDRENIKNFITEHDQREKERLIKEIKKLMHIVGEGNNNEMDVAYNFALDDILKIINK